MLTESEYCIVVNKPAGLIVHSDGRTEESSVAEWVLEKWPQLKDVGERWLSPQGETILRPGLVQRLDRTTSGVMIIAKTQSAWEYFRAEFKARRVDKVYRAFVYGNLAEEKGRIVAEIKRTTEVPRRWQARDCAEDDRRAAITDWWVLKNGTEAAFIEARPKTGRTHQIRVHTAHIGHPIVADHLYASDRKPILNFNRPALHAYEIKFMLPDGKRVSYAAPMPEDFEHALTRHS